MTEADIREYQALTAGAGLVDFHGRTLIELTGRDRATFLHNFCTNNIRTLAPGQGCEAFVTSVQGKTLGHVLVFCEAESLVLETVAGQGPTLLAHLDRYLLRDDVVLTDRSEQWAELLLSGQTSAAVLTACLHADPPVAMLSGLNGQIAGHAVSVWRVPIAGNECFLIRTDAANWAALSTELQRHRVLPCSVAPFEAARIEAGWPMFGRDITPDNLPQEVGRDSQAISFTKGCYLGQETIARIDALGHVNRTLCGLRFAGTEIPPTGTEVTASLRDAGHVTSSIWSPRLGAPLALGYVRRGSNEPGVKLDSQFGQAEVIRLPV